MLASKAAITNSHELLVHSWILTSHQSHKVISGRAKINANLTQTLEHCIKANEGNQITNCISRNEKDIANEKDIPGQTLRYRCRSLVCSGMQLARPAVAAAKAVVAAEELDLQGRAAAGKQNIMFG